MIKKRNIDKLDKNIVMMKNINKRLMRAKLKHYKNIKKESKK
jgi:ABC-type phosphonate transport system ATPase subunit